MSANNGLFYIYSDHLGSASLLVNDSNNPVADGRTWYLPFGGYRPGSAPTLLWCGLLGSLRPLSPPRHIYLPVTSLLSIAGYPAVGMALLFGE